jgi:hypothetical protein
MDTSTLVIVLLILPKATLYAHVWRPAGGGPFPAILVNMRK